MFKELTCFHTPLSSSKILLCLFLIVLVGWCQCSRHLRVTLEKIVLRRVVPAMVTFQTLRQFYLDFFVRVLILHNLQSFGIVELPCEVGVKWFRQYTVLVAHLLGAHGLDYPVVPPSII